MTAIGSPLPATPATPATEPARIPAAGLRRVHLAIVPVDSGAVTVGAAAGFSRTVPRLPAGRADRAWLGPDGVTCPGGPTGADDVLLVLGPSGPVGVEVVFSAPALEARTAAAARADGADPDDDAHLARWCDEHPDIVDALVCGHDPDLDGAPADLGVFEVPTGQLTIGDVGFRAPSASAPLGPGRFLARVWVATSGGDHGQVVRLGVYSAPAPG